MTVLEDTINQLRVWKRNNYTALYNKEKRDLVSDALILLEEYQKNYDLIREWVPVTEGFPKEDGDYWVYNESEEEFVATYDSCIDEESERFGFWREYYDTETLGYKDSEWYPISGITHWMKKPVPPQNESEVTK